mgnify:CR=1 FL=1
MVDAAGDEPLARPWLAGGQRIGPAFGAIWALIVGKPNVELHIGQSAEPLAQHRFIGIGEPAPTVDALPCAVFEADVERSAWAQRVPQPRQRAVHRSQRHVQQAGAAPDAIELRDLVDILEASDRDLEPAVGAGESGQLRGRVEGRDLKAGLGEGLGITTGPAAGIEDVGLGREFRKEPLMDRCHVDADGRAEEFGRELFVVLVGVVHPWQRLGRRRCGCQRTR